MATTYTQEEWEQENNRLRDLYAAERTADVSSFEKKLADASAEATASKEAATKELQEKIDKLNEANSDLRASNESLNAQITEAFQVMDSVKAQVAQFLTPAESLLNDLAKRVQGVIPQLHKLASDVTDVVSGSPLAKQARADLLLEQQKQINAELKKLGGGAK